MSTDTVRPVQPAARDAEGSVVLTGVTKRYGDAVAVDSLDLRVEPGEFLSLLGPSGCGKTTTLRMIAGFEHPDEGDVTISGASVVGVAPHGRDVNTVFQAYALFPHMSVAENVAYGLQQKRVKRSEIKDRVVEALDLVKMRSFADRKPGQLSGGQQQRIALARALVNRPAVLLLDEPLSALDRQLREEMQLELKLIQARLGTTFIFVTHDQGEALSMSDRIAIMRGGRIEQLADAETVYHRPSSAYVAAFVGQQNFVIGTITKAGDAIATRHTTIVGEDRPVGAPGGSGQAAVRPEFIDIVPGRDAQGPNQVVGHLVNVSPLGETQQFLVRLDDRQSILVRRPTPTAPRIAPGESVVCSWNAADVRFFEADDDPAAAGHVAPLSLTTENAV